jgi:hypothetical protein
MDKFKDKVKDFFEKHCYKLMSVFISIQAILFIVFCVLFCLEYNKNWQYVTYVIGTMVVFNGFMIQFAHHSVI